MVRLFHQGDIFWVSRASPTADQQLRIENLLELAIALKEGTPHKTVFLWPNYLLISELFPHFLPCNWYEFQRNFYLLLMCFQGPYLDCLIKFGSQLLSVCPDWLFEKAVLFWANFHYNFKSKAEFLLLESPTLRPSLICEAVSIFKLTNWLPPSLFAPSGLLKGHIVSMEELIS